MAQIENPDSHSVQLRDCLFCFNHAPTVSHCHYGQAPLFRSISGSLATCKVIVTVAIPGFRHGDKHDRTDME